MRAFLPSIIATHEFVVPRSIPMTLPITLLPFAFGVFRCSILPQSEDCDHRGTSPWPCTRLLLPKACRSDGRGTWQNNCKNGHPVCTRSILSRKYLSGLQTSL